MSYCQKYNSARYKGKKFLAIQQGCRRKSLPAPDFAAKRVGLARVLIAPMALAQHARDAQMARTMLDARFTGTVALIAGAGHARQDRGVPYYLRLAEPHSDIVSIAFREVAHDSADPHVLDVAAYDYVWFTPRVDDEDPCAAFDKK